MPVTYDSGLPVVGVLAATPVRISSRGTGRLIPVLSRRSSAKVNIDAYDTVPE